MRFSPKSPESYDLARQCEFPLLVEKAVVSKSLRKIAKDLKKPILVFEGGEALRLENYIVTKYPGHEEFIDQKGMLDGELKSLENVKVFRKTIWERSPEGGLLTYRRKAGSLSAKMNLLRFLMIPSVRRKPECMPPEMGSFLDTTTHQW
ncbi:MAG: hypothetical protein IPI30_12115 [Saprospiraceae bacterium]|nr:hypothetical protein [Candidatus Vicinibacter affinis]